MSIALVALVAAGVTAMVALQVVVLGRRARHGCASGGRRMLVPLRWLARVLLWVVLLPAYLVAWVVHVVARRGSRLLGRPDPSGWGAVGPPAPGAARRTYTATAARSTAEVRWAARRGALVAVTALLGVQAIIAVAVVRLRSEPGDASFGGIAEPGALDSAALRDVPWAAAASAESGEVSAGTVFAPYVGFALRDYEGRYFNVRNRVRRSYEPVLGSEPALDVWFFGGSAMFGFDLQRDLHTIPSEVARLAEADGLRLRVRNYGAPSYVNFTESVLLAMLLGQGQQPDLVVFYDGVNDLSAKVLDVVAGSPAPSEPTYLSAEMVRQVLAGSRALPSGTPEPAPPLSPSEPATRPLSATLIARSTVAAYRAGADLVEALADHFGFEVLRYWQPSIYTRQRLDPGEQDRLDELRIDDEDYETMAGIDRLVRARLPVGTVDLGSALDGVTGPVYTDQVHTNEAGAAAVAAAMYRSLAPVARASRAARSE